MKFEVGDKVKLLVNVGPDVAMYKFGVAVGDVLAVVCDREPAPGFFLGYDQVYIDWANEHNSHFELVEEKNMFNLKKEKWFIRVNSQTEWDTVQSWLEENYGTSVKCTYDSFGKKKVGMTNTDDGGQIRKSLMWIDESSLKETPRTEIKFIFKIVIDTIEFPVIETQAQKDLKVLEEQIQELSKQAAKLKESIK